MPDNPNPIYAAFSPVIGMYDGQPKICLMSMSRDPAALYWVEPAYARGLAANLVALADALDPPKSEWAVTEQSGEPGKLVARIKKELRKKRKVK